LLYEVQSEVQQINLLYKFNFKNFGIVKNYKSEKQKRGASSV